MAWTNHKSSIQPALLGEADVSGTTENSHKRRRNNEDKATFIPCLFHQAALILFGHREREGPLLLSHREGKEL